MVGSRSGVYEICQAGTSSCVLMLGCFVKVIDREKVIIDFR